MKFLTFEQFKELLSKYPKLEQFEVAHFQGNKGAMAFLYDKELEDDANRSKMLETLACMSGKFVFKAKLDKKDAYRTLEIPFYGGLEDETPAKVSGTPEVPSVYGIFGDDNLKNYVDDRVRLATEQAGLGYREKELAAREKALSEERRTFLEERDSVLGVLTQKLAPYLAGLVDKRTAPRQQLAVAGLGDAPISPEAVTPAAPAAEEVDDSLTEELNQLLTDWEAADPQGWLPVLRKIVGFAASGEKMSLGMLSVGYDDLKNILLQ